MTTDKTTATTARLALAAHQKHLADLIGQASALQRRIAGFRTEADAAHPAVTSLKALHAQRREVLAEIALGESDATVLDLADQELENAEAQARIAARGVEIAQAGAERLGREHAGLVGQLTAEQRKGDALRYAAGVELASSLLHAYRASLEAMGIAYADLLGTCLAVERFADPAATPHRLHVIGDMRSAVFGAPLPSLADFDREAFNFDYSARVEGAEAAALAELVAG